MPEIIIDKEMLARRFMEYVQVDTQSDPQSNSFPSTEKQKNLSKKLVEELKGMGIKRVELDEFGYVYTTIPGNTEKTEVPVICFCSHVDTAPDCSGNNVKPLLHKNYQEENIVLPDDKTQILSPATHPYLRKHIGGDIITASGLTLLGADDKAGVAIIMQAAQHIISKPDLKHGDIKILFTPDEEVGRGTAKVNLEKIGADFCYTLDGGEAGSLEDETFSADGVIITIHGVIAHPGYAKNKLVNAIKIAGEILEALPKSELAPEVTERKEGFIHPVRIEGIAERAEIEFIIRDFEDDKLKEYEEQLKRIAEEVVDHYLGAKMEFKVNEQYRNMKQILDENPEVVENAKAAIKRAGLSVRMESIRGGTDGSRLSFMGLPCPNLFTGMQAIHSKLEWIGVNDMAKATETILHLCQIWEENAPS